jgi:hypothetical protein
MNSLKLAIDSMREKPMTEFEKWCKDHIKYTVKYGFIHSEILRRDQELLEKNSKSSNPAPENKILEKRV